MPLCMWSMEVFAADYMVHIITTNSGPRSSSIVNERYEPKLQRFSAELVFLAIHIQCPVAP